MNKHSCPELIAAIAILATERDAWRKLETEMAAERERLRRVAAAADILVGQTRDHPVPSYWTDAFAALDISLLELTQPTDNDEWSEREAEILSERDRLKERVEKLRAALRLIQKASTVFSSCLVAKEALQSDEREG